MHRLIFIAMLLAITGYAAERKLTPMEQAAKELEDYKQRQRFIDSIKADKTKPAPPSTEEQKARAEKLAAQRAANTPAAQLARSPDGLLILSFTPQSRDAVRVRLKNITKSSVSVDGSKLRAYLYDTQTVTPGSMSGSMLLAPGEQREVTITLQGANRWPTAIGWSGAAAWTTSKGEIYADTAALLQAEKAARIAATNRRLAAESPLVQVKEGFVPKQK